VHRHGNPPRSHLKVSRPLPSHDTPSAAAIIADYIGREAREGAGALVVGLCGAQGSGKSTVARSVQTILAARGRKAVILSLDDLYLTRAERGALARHVHPLLAARGPPGTHDVALGAALLARLKAGEDAVLPVFDKIADDRAEPRTWPTFHGPADVVLFEGWCVGARPQPQHLLVAPINTLERERDPQGAWREYVNQALGQDYPALFGQIDRLIMLRAPSFEVVAGWRLEQESSNLARRGGKGRGMDAGEVTAFIQYYERLTRWMLEETPARADLTLDLDEARRVVGVKER
jgi:D-glycerate 3-kinase